MSPLDKQLQATLQRLTSALKQGTKSYLLADHLALARMGPLALSAVKDGGLTYVDNPATHWVLDSFKARSPGPSGGKQRAEHATQVLDELTALNRGKGIAEHVLQTQKGIADRIDKVRIVCDVYCIGQLC
jgi:hypothetical protein